MSWDSRFAEPIELPGGVRLASLREAIVHLVNTVPPSERVTPVILTAAELIASARHVVLKQWMEIDPARALHAAIPEAIARELPSAIARHLERHVAGTARY